MKRIIPVIRVSRTVMESLEKARAGLVQKRVWVKDSTHKKGHYRMQWVAPDNDAKTDGKGQIDLFSEPEKKPEAYEPKHSGKGKFVGHGLGDNGRGYEGYEVEGGEIKYFDTDTGNELNEDGEMIDPKKGSDTLFGDDVMNRRNTVEYKPTKGSTSRVGKFFTILSKRYGYDEFPDRSFDDIFEMNDGDEVVVGIIREAKENPSKVKDILYSGNFSKVPTIIQPKLLSIAGHSNPEIIEMLREKYGYGSGLSWMREAVERMKEQSKDAKYDDLKEAASFAAEMYGRTVEKIDKISGTDEKKPAAEPVHPVSASDIYSPKVKNASLLASILKRQGYSEKDFSPEKARLESFEKYGQKRYRLIAESSKKDMSDPRNHGAYIQPVNEVYVERTSQQYGDLKKESPGTIKKSVIDTFRDGLAKALGTAR